MPEICARPIKPLRRSVFWLGGLITPTLKVVRSNRIGHTTPHRKNCGGGFLSLLRITECLRNGHRLYRDHSFTAIAPIIPISIKKVFTYLIYHCII